MNEEVCNEINWRREKKERDWSNEGNKTWKRFRDQNQQYLTNFEKVRRNQEIAKMMGK